MDAGGAGLLGDADDGVLDLLRGGHHQVRQLVDDADDIRIRTNLALGTCRCLVLAGDNLAVIVLDLAHARGLHIHVALLHLLHQPLEGRGGLLRLGNNGRNQVRDALIRRELDHLWVDEDQAYLLRGGAGKQRDQHGVHERGLTGTGSAGNQQVRHLLHGKGRVFALNILAQANQHWVRGRRHAGRVQDLAQVDHFAVWVRNLNTHCGLARNRGEQAQVIGSHGIGQVGLQVRNLRNLNAWSKLNLIAGHRGATAKASYLSIDVELFEDIGNGLDDAVIDLGAFLRRRTWG